MPSLCTTLGSLRCPFPPTPRFFRVRGVFGPRIFILAVQGYDVTLLEAGKQPGGLVAGWKTASGKSVEVGIHGTP